MDWLANISIQWVIVAALALALLRIGIAKSEAIPRATAASTGEFIEALLFALVLVFLVIRPFFFQAFYIPSGSMLPTLHIGDRILVNKLLYRIEPPRRGDIVVFKAPPAASPAQVDFIKRCVGLPGDTVELQDGHIVVTNKTGKIVDTGLQSDDRYLLDPSIDRYDRFEFQSQNPDFTRYTVPPGHLWVMGDNRNDSEDSHVWGPLNEGRLLGKASFIFWPPRRIGLLH